MQQIQTYKHATDYPEIFHSYWGAFRLDENEFQTLEQIFENRNTFVRDFDVVKMSQKKNHSISTMIWNEFKVFAFDHCECYIDSKGRKICLTSPYYQCDDLMKRFNFVPYNKLYHPDAYTYVRIFDVNECPQKTLRKEWNNQK